MQPAAARSVDVDVDVELIIQAARLAVTTRTATKPAFVRHLEVSDDLADQLLRKLEHCEVIAGDEPGQPRRILTTSGELPGVIEEFRRRA